MQVVSKSKLSIPIKDINVDTPNRYEILKNGLNCTRKENILGRGSFGTVVKGIYKGQEVAVKILKSVNKSQMFTIKNESNILGWKHKNIIEILKIDSTPTYSIIIMTRFPGQCLQFILDKMQITLRHRIYIILDILNGLNYCHKNGIIHLDIKPQNILISYDQSIILQTKQNTNYVCKICDFGSSLKINDSKNNENIQPQGTIRYMSPEMLKNHNISSKSDIYSLGITMWQLKTNIYPYADIKCNETVAYKVIKENLRPDSIYLQSNNNKLNIPNDHKLCFCKDISSELLNNSVENMENLLNSKDLQIISPFRKNVHSLDKNKLEYIRKSTFKINNGKNLSELPYNSYENIENLINSSGIQQLTKLQNCETVLHKNKFENLQKSPFKIRNNNKLSLQKNLFNVEVQTTKDITNNIYYNDENSNNCQTDNNIEFFLKKIFMNNYENVNKDLENQYENIYKICWNCDSIKRPNSRNLIKQLYKILKEI